MFFALLADTTAWQFWPEAALCVSACDRVLQRVKFKVPKKTAKQCHHLYVNSLFACVSPRCLEDELDIGFRNVNKTCVSKGVPLPAFAPWTDFHNVSVVTWPDAKGKNLTTTIVPDADFFELAYDTEV